MEGKHKYIHSCDGNSQHDVKWMKHSNLVVEMDADYTFETPLVELDDGTPFDIDQS